MSTPSLEGDLSPEAADRPPLRILVFGHPSANPEQVAAEFGGIANPSEIGHCDLGIFVINPSTGIDPQTIAQWEALNDVMAPRMVVVTGLENTEADFDDAVLLANRVFDMTVTPYLVLHDDAGVACALISLADLTIRDYSTRPATIKPCESEHETLVSEFRNEYLAAMDVLGEDGFAAGMAFPAVPLWIEKGIGTDIVRSYIARLNQ